MGRIPCCDKKLGLKRGPWTPEEDELLIRYINKNGHGSWRFLPNEAGLLRCGKSCRLRWTNYLRPDIKRGPFSPEDEKLVIQLHGMLGNRKNHQKILDDLGCRRYLRCETQLPGRTDNEIKNLWNTHLKKRLLGMGIDPQTHEPCTSVNWPSRPPASSSTRHMAQWESARLEAESRLSKESLLLTPASDERANTDYFLRIWNSEVGESFRNLNKGAETETACRSPISRASSSTKNGPVSGTTTEIGLTVAAASPAMNNQKSYTEYFMARSDCTSSGDLEDSSNTALQLLLDFSGTNDMSFLEGHTDNYEIYPALFN